MKISLNKHKILGTLPGANPPVLAWHEFEVFNDSGFVGHLIDGNQRAKIDCDKFAEYVKVNEHFSGLVVTVDNGASVTTKTVAAKSAPKKPKK